MRFFKKKPSKIENCGKIDFRFYTLQNELTTILNKCLKPQYELIKIEQEIGAGSYGKVYSAHILTHQNRDIKVAVKYLGKNTKNQMIKEFNNSVEMAKNNLGPRIYKVFLYQNHLNKYKGIMVMEYMSFNAFNALGSSLSIKQKKLIIYEMLILIHKSAKIAIKNKGIFCFDIKLKNFMVNIYQTRAHRRHYLAQGHKVGKVRMIDFDYNYCDKELKFIKNLRKYVKNYQNPLVKSISEEKDTYLILLLTMIGSLALFWQILDFLSKFKNKRREKQNKEVLQALLPHIQTLCRDSRLRMGISIILQKEIQILNTIMYYSVKFQIKDLIDPSRSQYLAKINKYLPNWQQLSGKERSERYNRNYNWRSVSLGK